jgi:hypothetical protein
MPRPLRENVVSEGKRQKPLSTGKKQKEEDYRMTAAREKGKSHDGQQVPLKLRGLL